MELWALTPLILISIGVTPFRVLPAPTNLVWDDKKIIVADSLEDTAVEDAVVMVLGGLATI
jgi:hypothetical protein